MSVVVVIKYFVLSLVFMQYVNARIDFVVDAVSNKVEAFGSDVAIISDVERKSFGIDEYSLKAAVELAFGKWPDDVFVRSPTPWGDLYKTYSWKQVERTLHPTKAKTLNSKSANVTFDTKNFENNSTSPLECTAAIFQKEAITISNTWTKSQDVNSGIKFNYRINLPIGDSGSSMSLSYKNNWGNAKTESQPVTIGSISGVKFKLPPNTKATATLMAEKGEMETQVNYDVTLNGQAALNYGISYQGHHFWGYTINDLISKSEKPLTLTCSENLKINFYKNAKIIVKEDVTNNVIAEINVPIDITQDFTNLRNSVFVTLPVVFA